MNNYYIHKLSIPKNIFKEFKLDLSRDDDPDNFYVLDSLSKVNIFVGPNNSRKSRFIRLVATLNDYEFETNDTQYHILVESHPGFLEEVKETIQQYEQPNYGEINEKFSEFKNANPFPNDNFIKTNNEYKLSLHPFFDYIDNLQGILTVHGRGMTHEEHRELQSELKKIVNKYKERLKDKSLPERLNYSFEKVYIPTLRGFRQFSQITDSSVDPYEIKTKYDYFNKFSSDTQSSPTIFSGYNLFSSLMNLYASSTVNREKKEKLEKFLSDRFYEEKKVVLTPHIGPGIVHIEIENEEERTVHDIGDGIQQLILLFFSMFENLGRKTIFFVEEPELFMHPGMQRQFLESIYSEKLFKGFQFFFTTHSNHFLDMTLDYENVSIFRCEKDKESGNSESNRTHVFNVDSPDESLLASLGVKNSSVFLTNSTIWVEGVTDRMYYRHFLKLYQEYLEKKQPNKFKNKSFKEDLHFSFVEYGGNNVTHWSFFDDDNPDVERLCARLMLIVDRDDDRKKQRRKQRIKDRLGEKRFVDLREVRCREVENLLSKDVLLKVVEEYEKDGSDINQSFRIDAHKNKPLGKFIEDVVLNNRKKREGSYKNEWGSINNKVSFARKAIRYSENYEDLSTPAKKITERIYKFVKENN